MTGPEAMRMLDERKNFLGFRCNFQTLVVTLRIIENFWFNKTDYKPRVDAIADVFLLVIFFSELMIFLGKFLMASLKTTSLIGVVVF